MAYPAIFQWGGSDCGEGPGLYWGEHFHRWKCYLSICIWHTLNLYDRSQLRWAATGRTSQPSGVGGGGWGGPPPPVASPLMKRSWSGKRFFPEMYIEPGWCCNVIRLLSYCQHLASIWFLYGNTYEPYSVIHRKVYLQKPSQLRIHEVNNWTVCL